MEASPSVRKKRSTGALAIRGVSIAVAIIVVLSFATVFYSAYADYRGISNDVSSAGGHAVMRTMEGTAEVISVNLTVPNDGLYTLRVSVACPGENESGLVVCQPASVEVPAGQSGVLQFKMTVENLAEFEGLMTQDIQGTIKIQLMPFASVSVGYDLGGLVRSTIS